MQETPAQYKRRILGNKGMWSYYGMHEERGKETISRLTEMMAGHDLNHLKQIEEILGGNQP